MRFLKALFKLAMLAGLGWAAYRYFDGQRRQAPAPLTALAPGADVGTPAPTRRPGAGTAPGGASRPSSGPAGKAPAPAPLAAWVDPVDDACPVSHPVKAKLASGIFHVPGGRHYERTVPDRCYRDAEAAQADGLRPSKQ